MSRRKKQPVERFVRLEHWMLKSPAWMTLPPDAKAIWLHVAMRFNGSNNGYISYAIREAEEIDLSKDRAARALDALIERGFLVVTRASGFSVKNRLAREFRLTHLPHGPHQTEPASRDFAFWSPAAKTKHSRKNQGSQSHQRDCSPEIEIIEPLTVAPARPWNGSGGVSQSQQRDTSIIPGSLAPEREPGRRSGGKHTRDRVARIMGTDHECDDWQCGGGTVRNG
jgi:hypothetical protein